MADEMMTPKGTGSVELNKAAFSSAEATSAGAVSATATLIIGNRSSGSTLAVTLPNGTTIGEYKIFTNKGAGLATITPDNFAGNTSFALQQNEGAMCIWDGSNWFLVGNQSVAALA